MRFSILFVTAAFTLACSSAPTALKPTSPQGTEPGFWVETTTPEAPFKISARVPEGHDPAKMRAFFAVLAGETCKTKGKDYFYLSGPEQGGSGVSEGTGYCFSKRSRRSIEVLLEPHKIGDLKKVVVVEAPETYGGLQPRDEIQQIDSALVRSVRDVVDYVQELGGRAAVKLRIIRDGRTLEVEQPVVNTDKVFDSDDLRYFRSVAF